MSKPIQDAALGELTSALQQVELPAERVARTRPLVEANNAVVAKAARERLTMDDNPGDFIAWLQSFEGTKP
jgi:hypothetical protein